MKRPVFAMVLLAACAAIAPAQQVRTNPGFTHYSVARNDDGSSALEPLGFTINLFGKIRSSAYVNNNGNITFDGPLSTFTPFGLRSTSREIIAPFFADVDTRPAGSKLVTYGPDTVNGRRAFGVNWVDVGYFANHVDKLNSFQLVLVDRSDVRPGDFDIEFNYAAIKWETGDASNGVNGFGGTPAAAGWSNGADTSFEFPGSLVVGAFLDSGPYALIRQTIATVSGGSQASGSAARPGRLTFRARDGVISPGLLISGAQMPDATVGVPYSQTMTATGADAPFRWTFQPDVIAPPGLTHANGVLAGTPTAAGTFSFTAGVTGNSEDGEITVSDRGSLTVRPPEVRITTSCPLPDAHAGAPYSQRLGASGVADVLWRARYPLELPPGLALAPNGLLAGTPQRAGTFQVNLEARAAGAVPAEILCKLNVIPASVQLGSCVLSRATVGVPFEQALRPSGGFAPYDFQLVGGLPRGMALVDGSVAGTPEMWGVWLFQIVTTDARGERQVQDCNWIVDPPRFTTQVCPLPGAVTGVPYAAPLGSGLTWSIAAGILPAGLTLNPQGSITGTPMGAGGAQFRLLATNAQGEQTAEACSLVVERGPLSVAGCPVPDARAGSAFSGSFTPLGGNAPYAFSTVAGSLPAGVSLSPDGTLQGTPTAAGTYSFTLRLRDVTQAAVLQACQWKVTPAQLRITTPCPLPDARAGEAYSQAFQAEGGQPPYRFAFSVLPDGISSSPEGVLTGSAAFLGGRSFTVRVTDQANRSSEQSCSLAVVNPVVPAITLLDPPPTIGTAVTNFSFTVQSAAPHGQPVRGQIVMQVTPDTAGTDPLVNSTDPLLAFANGQRTATFTIPAGQTRAVVPVVSTGTVASTVNVHIVNLTAAAPVLQTPPSKTFRIPAAAPSISAACYGRTNNENGVQLEFRVTGISNTRELASAQVTIPGLGLGKPNIPVPSGFLIDSSDTLSTNIEAIAQGFYSTTGSVRTGGAFTLAIPVNLDTPQASIAPSVALGTIRFNLSNRAGATGFRDVPACQ